MDEKILTNDIIRRDLLNTEENMLTQSNDLNRFFSIFFLILFVTSVYPVRLLKFDIIGIILLILTIIIVIKKINQKVKVSYAEEGYWECIKARLIKKEERCLIFRSNQENIVFQFPISIFDTNKRSKIDIGDEVFLVVENNFSVVTQNDGAYAKKYYLVSQYSTYEDIGDKKAISNSIDKKEITDFELLIEILYLILVDYVSILILILILILIVSAMISGVMQWKYDAFIHIIYYSCILISIIVKGIKKKSKSKNICDKIYSKRYLLVDINENVYGLIINRENSTTLVREYSKSKYEYRGTKFRDNNEFEV